ncbi:MAG: pyridoxamine 5-phosphate oxidase family protein [Acidimicrobiia bacterium]|jgi:nitroimidazol reductase NimA-like FMN-containing flavoprotein (pyridoxamine 5'-phosphate oxidase superfamily)|nr:pyridoxamine 5-phosphate oxidase family protein [Acidimicrobiia bacterium]
MARTPATIRRLPEKSVEDRAVIDAILDEGFVCHVAYLIDGRPVVIPTLYVRDGDSCLLHGSTASGIAAAARRGSPLSIAVTLVDGLVVARSGFESSVNYRSVVIHGHGTVLSGDAHARALDLMVEGLIPGRLADIRSPTDIELRKTTVVSVPLDTISAKVSAGPPEDDIADIGTGVWAGVVPMTTTYGDPEPSPDLEPNVEVPDYLTTLERS